LNANGAPTNWPLAWAVVIRRFNCCRRCCCSSYFWLFLVQFLILQ
jgi:hypothetical protein